MKSPKKLLLLTAIMIMGLCVHQAQAQRRVGLGIRGGVNFSNLNDTDANYDTRTGLMAGLYFDYAIANSPVMLQPEILYTQKGYEVGDGTVKLDYLEIPVLAKFNFITNGSITPNVYFGPSIGFNVNAEDKAGIFQGDIDNNVKDTELGVVVGAGLDFGRVDLGVRYGAGLTEVFDNGDSAKNGVFSITAGIGF